MSVQLLRDLVEGLLIRPCRSPAHFAVLALLSMSARDDQTVHVSPRFIAARVGMSERSVRRVLRELEAAGRIHRGAAGIIVAPPATPESGS